MGAGAFERLHAKVMAWANRIENENEQTAFIKVANTLHLSGGRRDQIKENYNDEKAHLREFNLYRALLLATIEADVLASETDSLKDQMLVNTLLHLTIKARRQIKELVETEA